MYQLYLASPNAAASAAQHPPCLPWLPAAASHPLLTNPEQAWQGSSLQQLWRQQWLVHQYALLMPGRERGRESRKKGDRPSALPHRLPFSSLIPEQSPLAQILQIPQALLASPSW